MEVYSHGGLQTCLYTRKKLIPGMQKYSEEMYIKPENTMARNELQACRYMQEIDSRHAYIYNSQVMQITHAII